VACSKQTAITSLIASVAAWLDIRNMIQIVLKASQTKELSLPSSSHSENGKVLHIFTSA
jgi:hypothetical protein